MKQMVVGLSQSWTWVAVIVAVLILIAIIICIRAMIIICSEPNGMNTEDNMSVNSVGIYVDETRNVQAIMADNIIPPDHIMNVGVTGGCGGCGG